MWISRGSLLIVALFLMMVLACSTSPGSPDVTEIVVDNPEVGGADVISDVRADAGTDVGSTPLVELRVASYNASLFREQEGQLVADLSDPSHEHARGIARILQHVRPDVVLINEFDYDADHEASRLFRTNFLEVAQGADEALDYPYVYVAHSNTGVHSGFDLDNSGQAVSNPGTQAYGNDAFGYGIFEGQYAFVIYSRYPLVANGVRTFQRFLWKEMPDNMMPEDWYSPEAAEVFRLSSKNHVDLAIEVDEHVLHILASHPTPPTFDGAERRNVRRNNDEIRLWNDYITPGAGAYIVDDEGQGGGLDENAFFVIVGDLNNDPFDGGGGDAIKDLLANERVTDPLPSSEGAVEKSERDGRANLQHVGDPKYDTADFSDVSVGNLRADYALPSSNTEVLGSGVFWPRQDEPLYGLTLLSDHHLVWVDIRLAR